MSNQTRAWQNKLTKRQLVGAFLLVVAGSLVAAYFSGAMGLLNLPSNVGGTDVEAEAKPLPVNVAEVSFVDSIEQSRTYTGTIRARNRSDLGFELSGRIKALNVDEGDVVEKGQILAELDTETLKAQKGATTARLAQANSLMDELNTGPRKEKIQAARATVAANQSRYDNAVLNLKRRTRLKEGGAISQEEFDQARFAERTARAQLDASNEQLAELVAGTRLEKIAGQKSNVRQLEAAAKEIEVAIEKSKLVAPFSGTVTKRYLDPGTIAQASAPVVKLVEQSHLEAWVGLPVSIVADIEIGSEHEVLVAGLPFAATASAKIQELDTATRTQTVLFTLESGASGKVVSGQLCELQITSSVDSSGFWIPTSALSKGVRGLWSVMVIQPEVSGPNFRTSKQDIEVLKTDSNRVLAKGTIKDGDRIVVNGVHRIADGQLVVPVE
ncbi:MAG: efflux RND transporter periplasmic adaptor subunit [Mariniblastus sp.]